MKRYLIIGLLLMSPIWANASGERHIELTSERIKELRIIDTDRYWEGMHYLGTIENWHLFGETLTDASGGMPWSSTFAYKLPSEQLTVELGWTLATTGNVYIASPNSCPKISKASVATGAIYIPTEDQYRCVWLDNN